MKMLGLALCAAALGFATASCGGDLSSSPTTSTGETETRYPNIIVTKQSPVPPTRTAPPPPKSQADAVSISIKGGKPVGGIERVRVKKGRPVLVVVRSDVTDTVHIHGYDATADVEADGTVRIPFTATISGVFDVELEERGLKIAQVTVR